MTKPNIVLIVADDQPKGLHDAMPFIRNQIKEKGLSIQNCVAPTALCSPARASLLTGKYANKHGCWINDGDPEVSAWPAFNANGNESDTIATRLKDLGYRTGIFGKYVNKFNPPDPYYIPPGWDTFVNFNAGYYGYTLKGTIYPEKHGNDPEDYSTDVLANHALEFVNSTPAESPLFLMFTPWGPHGGYTPAPRHQGTWSGDTGLPPSFNEEDMSDKPAWMQALPYSDLEAWTQRLQDMHEAVMSIDEAAKAIWEALGAARQADTIFIFTSDNGKMIGSHRFGHKDLPHKWASEVPLFLRWDGKQTPNVTSTRLTPNVDITATIAEAVGITGWPIDGKSIFTSVRPGGIPMQQMDNWSDQHHPGYIGWRQKEYLYVEYTDGMGVEFYDYTNDPDEMNSLHNSTDPFYVDKISDLKARARANTPYPPGFILS